jgi:hypothetical protein
MNTLEQIQSLLGVTPDGMWGPKSQSALDVLIHGLPASAPVPVWPFTIQIVGDDIVVGPGLITCFGGWGAGISDPQDNGDTASGINTKTRAVSAVSIPMDGRDFPSLGPAEHKALDGCPIRRLRNAQGLTAWHTPVEVTIGTVVFTPPDGIIDLGPGLQASKPGELPHILDLTVWAAMRVQPTTPIRQMANSFEVTGSYRIIGGAKLLPASTEALPAETGSA